MEFTNNKTVRYNIMVQAETRSFNVDGLTYNVPASIEEFDTMANKPGTALECAIAYVTEKDTLVKLRKKVIEELAATTGIGRKMRDSGKTREVEFDTGEKNEDGTPKMAKRTEKILVPDETEVQYFKRVCAQQKVEPEAFKGLIQEKLNSIPFDPSASERSSKEKKIPQVYLDTAQEIIDQGAGDAVAADLTQSLGYTVTADLESIAGAIQTNEARLRKERASQYINKATARA
jgi:hypothetical protein